jgi:hypothetical protein
MVAKCLLALSTLIPVKTYLKYLGINCYCFNDSKDGVLVCFCVAIMKYLKGTGVVAHSYTPSHLGSKGTRIAI